MALNKNGIRKKTPPQGKKAQDKPLPARVTDKGVALCQVYDKIGL
jgi:hypothetical protein